MLIGICGSADQASALKELGFDFLEENVQRFLKPRESNEAFQSSAPGALTVPAANCFLPGDLKVVGPKVDSAALHAYADRAFERAHNIGLDTIVFGSGGARAIPEGWAKAKAEEQFVEALKELGARAEGWGVYVAVEPLNRGECNFINSLAEGAALVRAADHPNVRLLVDFFHMLRDDEPAAEILKVGDLIQHVHIAEKAKRTAPGVAGDDFSAFLGALKEVGYSDKISLECGWGDLNAEAPKSIAYLRKQMKAAGL